MTTTFKIGKYNIILYKPDGAAGLLPAFIFIPGAGETGTNADLLYKYGPLNFIQEGWAPSFIVVGAQPDVQWPPDRGQTPTFMRTILDGLIDGDYGIDPNKVYLTGLSNGAANLMEYMQYETDDLYHPIAAVVPMSMNMFPVGGNFNTGTDFMDGGDLRFKTTGMWAFCGNQDAFTQSMSHYVDEVKAIGGYAKYTEYNGAHGGWNDLYDPSYANPVNIYDACLEFSASGGEPTPPPTKTLLSVVTTYNYTDGTSKTTTEPE